MPPRVVRALALLLLAATTAIGAIVLADARAMIGNVWTGFGLSANGMVGPTIFLSPQFADGTPTPRFQDLIVRVDEEPTRSAADVKSAVARRRPGDLVRYELESTEGTRRTMEVPAVEFAEGDWNAILLPFAVGGLIGMLIGAVPVLARPDLLVARVFFLMNLGFALQLGFLLYDYYLGHRFTPWNLGAGFLASAAFLYFALIFPSRIGPAARFPRGTAVGVAIVCGITWTARAVALATLDGIALRVVDWVEFGLFTGAATLFLANIAWSSRAGVEAAVRQQARFLLCGIAIVGPGGLLFDASMFGLIAGYLPVLLYTLPAWALGLLMVYAMIAHNLFEMDAVFRRGLTAATIALLTVGVQLLVLALVSPWAGGPAAWAAAGTVTVLAIGAAAAALPLRQGVESLVEAVLFPRLGEARAIVHEASRDLARARGQDEILATLRDAAARSLAASSVRVVVGAADAALDEIAPEGEPIRLDTSDPLRPAIRRAQSLRFQVPTTGRRGPSKSAIRRAAELDAAILVPLPPNEARSGALLAGERTDGRLYTGDDEMLLETLAAQTSVALENAHAWESVQELQAKLRAENVYLREEIDLADDTGGVMIGRSPALRAVLSQVERVAPTDAPVLVTGETGSGKELLVRTIHERSRRADRILVKVACAALPESLLESELFGYEAGAFTGANRVKHGRFEVADGGTIFLDDVDTLPLGVQSKLLRALQEGEVQRLGSNDVRHVDVRIIAATNRDLLREVRVGAFREDLYYRLAVVPLALPPLRDRREDIPGLVEHFIREEAPRLDRDVRSVSADALAELERYDWPGNIRELRNVVQRALVLGRDPTLRLPGPLGTSPATGAAAANDAPGTLAEQTRALRVRLIREALAKAGGNRTEAARELGVQRQNLTRMMRSLEIDD